MTNVENEQEKFENESDTIEYLLPLNSVEKLDNAILINRILTKALRMSQFEPTEHYPAFAGVSPKMINHHSLKDDVLDEKSIRSVHKNNSWISCADLRNDKSDYDIGYEAVIALREFNKAVKPENLLEYTEGWLAGQELLTVFDSKDPKVSLSVESINNNKDRDRTACIYYDLPETIRMDVKELTKEDKRVLYFVYADHQFLLTAVVHRGV